MRAGQKPTAKNRKYYYYYVIINKLFYVWKADNILCRFKPLFHGICGLGLHVWYIDVGTVI